MRVEIRSKHSNRTSGFWIVKGDGNSPGGPKLIMFVPGAISQTNWTASIAQSLLKQSAMVGSPSKSRISIVGPVEMLPATIGDPAARVSRSEKI